MKIRLEKYRSKFLSVLLIFLVLFSSFGISFYVHKCKTSGNVNVSIMSIDHCSHETLQIHSCCDSKNVQCDNYQNSSVKQEMNHSSKKISKDCCTFNEENFTLSSYNFVDKLQKLVVTSDYYNQFIDFINDSKVIDKLEQYYKDFEFRIIKPTQTILKFISHLASPSSLNEDPVS